MPQKNRQSERDPNQAPPEYNSGTLPLTKAPANGRVI